MKRLRLLGGIVFVVTLLWTVGFVFGTPKASAATLNVVAGTDGIEENSQCQLSEAIQNINDQAQTNTDCIAGDGTNDTITLPAGTITLSDNLLEITQSISIEGQGMGQTIIDGDESYRLFTSDTNKIQLNLQDLTVTSWAGFVIESNRGDVTLTNFEIDGNGANVGTDGAMIIGNLYPESNDVNAENVYIHDITANSSYIHIFNVWNRSGGTTNAIANNVTISDISNSGGGINVMVWGVGAMRFDDAYGNFNGVINNTTIDGITSNAGIASIVSLAFSSVSNETSDTEVYLENSTISNINSGISVFGVDGSFGSFGASLDGTATSNVDLFVENTLISNNTYSENPTSCTADGDISLIIGGNGVPNLALTSLGGNISDDNSCTDYFTDPSDQNNVDPTDLHLGTLGNYGGSVPTIPLLPGSIAIDSGVDVAGLTTDARGITRPQCAAFDSGAYEYNGTCPVVNNTTPLHYPDPITNSTVSLVLPSDVTNGTVSAISPTTIPKDTFFSYPLGLTSFQFDTTIGATKTITLYYDLPGDPSSYTARKYNTNTKTFSTIQGATITRVTYNNKSQIKLTYDITDGGPLDQDNTANGTIIDPVGLAQASVGVPNTGLR